MINKIKKAPPELADEADSWMVVTPSATIRNLVFSKYTPMVKNYVRIYGMNAAGDGQKSAAFMFVPV